MFLAISRSVFIKALVHGKIYDKAFSRKMVDIAKYVCDMNGSKRCNLIEMWDFISKR